MGARIEKIKKWFEVRTVRYWKEEYRLMEGAYNFEREMRHDYAIRAKELDEEREGVYRVQKNAVKIQSEALELYKTKKNMESELEQLRKRVSKFEWDNYLLKGALEENGIEDPTEDKVDEDEDSDYPECEDCDGDDCDHCDIRVRISDTLPEEARTALEDKEPAQCEEVVEEHEEGVVTEN